MTKFGKIGSNNSFYEGEIKNELANGLGKFYFKDGSIYEGEFVDGYPHGYGTKIQTSNGLKVVGEWRKGLPYGQVTATMPDGYKYVGEVRNNFKNGKGTIIYSDGRKYEGEWRDDYEHGQGTITFKSGNKYVGEFKKGEIEGHGTLFIPNGEKYIGNWEDGEPKGKGTYIDQKGWKWIGEFNRDLNFKDGTGTMIVEGYKYEGQFDKKKYPHGMGKITYPDGSTFEGKMNKANRESGTLSSPKGGGFKYVGQFKNDKFHGDGVFTNELIKLEGKWEDGKFFHEDKFVSISYMIDLIAKVVEEIQKETNKP